MNRYFSRLPASILFIFSIYFLGMSCFFLYRMILLAVDWNQASEIPFPVLLKALWMGIRFDTVINGYLLTLPLVTFFVLEISGKPKNFLSKIFDTYFIIAYAICFFIGSADIPWFNHNASRLTVASLQWTGTPGMMFKIVFEDPANYPYFFLWIAVMLLFIFLLKKIKKNFAKKISGNIPRTTSLLVFLFAMGCLFIGIRGRLAIKSPIRWGTAFFSNNNFANQLGLNPVYTFMRSWLDANNDKEAVFNFMDDQEAISKIRENFGGGVFIDSISPVARKVVAVEPVRRLNVVLVLMESMTAKNMQRFGNGNRLTPVLDSLLSRSILFSDFYSDGIHTFNGIYSSLFGFHSLPLEHHMKDIRHQQLHGGLANLLHSNGYRTTFFTTHDEQFDNMAGFLLPNGFENIISEKDFSEKEVLSTLGVPDHVMFDRMIEEANQTSKNGKPFFMSCITGSNHGPYILPEGIPLTTHSKKLKEKLIEYADWAVGKFLSDCSRQQWFDSTIFILTGDHGALTEGFDHYLAFHHIPLIIYAPKIFSEGNEISSPGGQADIYPTIAGILNLSYLNNSMGIDLFRQQRKIYPFTYDDEACGITEKNFLSFNKEREGYYEISVDGKNLIAQKADASSDSLKSFVQAVMQVMQVMRDKHELR